jgi:pimeloyl-ACP methyl ester carboxylesterase
MPYAKTHPQPRTPTPQPKAAIEVVDPIWLFKALALSVVAALICAYATLCLLFYQGDWQLVLNPSHTVDRTPASAGLVSSDLRFDAAETGQPRLTAWWIPATPQQSGFQPKYKAFTVLYLHDGSGSLADTVPALARLHTAGLNVFAIDYRGFGASDGSVHPSQTRMAEDTAAALEYLTGTRHIPARNVILYGAGLGAALAANLAHAHPELPAVILDNPDPDPASRAVARHPSRIVPVRLLFGRQFDIAIPLSSLTTPKLLIAGGLGSCPDSDGQPHTIASLQSLFQRTASPSLTVTLPPTNDDSAYQATLSRFLDQYLPTR